MVCTGVNCGDLTGRRYSEYLEGALSTNQEFFYINMEIDDIVGPGYKHVGIFSHKSITSFIPKDINVDSEHDILVCDAGAIVDAYDFNGMEEKEIKYLSEAIINNCRHNYPGYELALVEGEFPLGVEGSLIVDNKLKKDVRPVMSSHILCISNYKEHLKGNNIKIKR